MNPDAPIETADADRFSYLPFAQGLAREIADYDRSNSFTIGINGPWGSGKTSLVNLTIEALKSEMSKGQHNAHAVILPYSPWIVGNTDTLLRELLPAIANSIRANVPKHKQTQDFTKAIKSLEQYGRAIRGVEMGLDVGTATASIFGLSVAPWLAPVIGIIGSIPRFFGLFKQRPTTLDGLKKQAQQALAKAEVRVLIILDDLDRLDPSEVVDMSRLIRSTLDLPHLTFLVAYDRTQVANSISRQLSVEGDAYLEKIIQLQVNLPECGRYDLTRAIAEDLQPVFGELTQRQSESVSRTLWGVLRPIVISTPRDIGRITNAVSFGWSMLDKNADAGDLLFITSIRVKAPQLYQWCKEYLEEYFLNEEGRLYHAETISQDFQDRLNTACEECGIDTQDILRHLGDTLPGIGSSAINSDGNLFFGNQSQADSDSSIQNSRLKSPRHWRNYFDLTEARNGISDANLARFIEDAVSNPEDAASFLLDQSEIVEPSGTNAGERLLDWIQVQARAHTLSPEQRMSVSLILANTMDILSDRIGPAPFFGVSCFTMGQWTLSELLEPLTDEQKLFTFHRMASEGSAISWLSYVLRSDFFAHGRIGDRQRGESTLLNSDDLDSVCEVLVGRLNELADSSDILNLYSLANPLLFWRDAIEESGSVRDRIEHVIVSEEALVQFVTNFKQLVRSTAGDYWRIDQGLLSSFCDFEMIFSRLQNLASNGEGHLASDAAEAIQMLERDR